MADTKPSFKVSKEPPMKLPDDAKPEAPPPIAAKEPAVDKWLPVDTAPQDQDARFVVRATVAGKPVPSTETIVRYRVSRKMSGGKWQHALTMIDDRLGTKLGFRPTEWNAFIPPPKDFTKPHA